MPEINGRLICCVCEADLGDASDPYRDPDCDECLKREFQEEMALEERAEEYYEEHKKEICEKCGALGAEDLPDHGFTVTLCERCARIQVPYMFNNRR